MTRIYLDEYAIPLNPPLGLGILRLLKVPKSDVPTLLDELLHKAENQTRDSVPRETVIELVEGLLRRFTELDREEMRKMFGLQDIRKSKVWQEAQEEAVARERRARVKKCLAKGMSVKEAAEFMEIPVKEVRRLAKEAAE